MYQRGEGYRIPAMALLLAVLAPTAACGPGRGVVEAAIDAYLHAVQTEDIDALYCLSTGAAGGEEPEAESGVARERFEAWARSEYEAYYTGRDRGELNLGSSGIVLAKAFTLGKGTYYTVDEVRSAGEGIVEADMPVRFAYGEINLSGLKPDTTFYVCGFPLGTIHAVRIPRIPGEEERDVLDYVVVRWTLVREPAADGCEERWTVNEVRPMPDTVRSEHLVWLF